MIQMVVSFSFNKLQQEIIQITRQLSAIELLP